MAMQWILAAAISLLTAAGALAQPAAGEGREVQVLVGDQQVLEPGFAVGDIAIGDPNVADFRVRPGRKSVLLLGKGSGRTKLICWDQTGKGRTEFTVIVQTREQAQAESKLRTLLRDLPSVKVERVEGDLVVSGTVSSEDDLALITRSMSTTDLNPQYGAQAAAALLAAYGVAEPDAFRLTYYRLLDEFW